MAHKMVTVTSICTGRAGVEGDAMVAIVDRIRAITEIRKTLVSNWQTDENEREQRVHVRTGEIEL